MLLNTVSRNKRRKNVKNQDVGPKVPLFDLKPSVNVMLGAKI